MSLRDGFFEECEELLEALADGLGAMEGGETDNETVNAVFRAVHSIKGGAGAFGLEDLVSFAHGFENVLDDVRSDKVGVDADVMQVFFRAGDQLAALVEAARDAVDADQSASQEILAELRGISGGEDVAEDEPDEVSQDEFAPIAFELNMDLPDEDAAAMQPATPSGPGYRIRFRAGRDLYMNGNDPALLFRSLSGFGTLATSLHTDGVKPLLSKDWDDPCLHWDLTLDTEAPLGDIRDVFEFVDGQCELALNDIDGNFLWGSDLSEPAVEPKPTEAPQSDTPEVVLPETPDPAIVVEKVEEKKDVKEVKPAKKPEVRGKSVQTTAKKTIRVDLDRVDRLINTVGELVISEAMLEQAVSEIGARSGSRLETAMSQLKQLSSEMQESVMAIRAQPVKGLFQRMSRILRESAQATGKSARIVTEGEATEVDRTVVERLVDPLTHMIRNSVDHGLEDKDVRLASGKPEQGTITLSAAHRSGRVVIELSDDGGGINRERVRAIAEQKGLIPANAELSDGEIDNLLFKPGFSTAENVSNLSGRGVGMDVVRNEIMSLGGRVSISSVSGQGTTLSISLPLTLAVLEGMIVKTADETVVVPITALRETIRASDASTHKLGENQYFLSVRENLVPIVDLGHTLGFRPFPPRYDDQTLLLIETESGAQTAVAVDRVFDQREVVIKGLESNYGHIPGVAAATILGDGRIALIIDTDQVVPNANSTADVSALELVAGE